jgi:hypothetical protein
MMMRLETVAKDLTAKLKAASSEQQRMAGLLACRLALQAAPMDYPVVLETLDQLQQYGVLPPQRIAELGNLAAQLDEKYFELQDNAEGDADLQAESLRLFSQARTVSALSFAGGDDALVAAMEAVYEASATDNDGSKIFKAVLSILS